MKNGILDKKSNVIITEMYGNVKITFDMNDFNDLMEGDEKSNSLNFMKCIVNEANRFDKKSIKMMMIERENENENAMKLNIFPLN